MERRRQGKGGRILAWSVHGYTALGLVIAALMAVLIVQGTEEAFRGAFLLMILAGLVDATDGWLARRAGVGQILPSFDGRRLDDIVDFHTFASLPLLLLWRSEILPGGAEWVLLLPLLASAYGFSRVDAKTTDGYFLGFPSYWNVVAFYLFFLEPAPAVSAGILVLFSALVFVPSRYLYLSRPGRLTTVSNLLGAVWTVLVVAILAGALGDGWVWPSLFFPVYYLVASWTLGLRSGRWR